MNSTGAMRAPTRPNPFRRLQLNETLAAAITISNLSSTLTTSMNSGRREATPMLDAPLTAGKHKLNAKKLIQVPEPSTMVYPRHIPKHKAHRRRPVSAGQWGVLCKALVCAREMATRPHGRLSVVNFLYFCSFLPGYCCHLVMRVPYKAQYYVKNAPKLGWMQSSWTRQTHNISLCQCTFIVFLSL